jgi:hypothetical protein
MSQELPPEAINVGDLPEQRIDRTSMLSNTWLYRPTHPPLARLNDVPRLEQNQPSQGQANFTDSSGPLFHMYVKMTEEEDDKMTKRWQKDADGILIFVSSRSLISALAL